MGGDEVVFGFDEAEESFGDLGLGCAAEGGEAEAVAVGGRVGGGGGGVTGASVAGADGEGAVPGGWLVGLWEGELMGMYHWVMGEKRLLSKLLRDMVVGARVS